VFIPNATLGQCQTAIKNKYGDIEIFTKCYTNEQLTLFFIEIPDKYYQNYIAECGKAGFVMKD